jgi:hypothetical protein
MGEKFRPNARRHNSRPVLQPAGMYGSSLGDGEVNCSLQTPPAIMRHGGWRHMAGQAAFRW